MFSVLFGKVTNSFVYATSRDEKILDVRIILKIVRISLKNRA